MDFEDALQRAQRLENVGPLRLRYETSLLICEPAPAKRDLRPPAIRLAGFALLLLALVTVLTSAKGAAPWPAVMLGAVGGGLLLTADRLFPAAARRRFILNFATESLRIDDVGVRPRTRTLHFDDIAALDIVPEQNGQFALVLTARTSPTKWVLARGIEAEHVEEVRKLWRLLSDAFGIRRPGVEL